MTLSTSPIPVLRAVALALALAGCNSVGYGIDSQQEIPIPDFASARVPPPPGVRPDGCWVRDVAPAQLETVTRQIEVSPAKFDEHGNQIAPARFRSETTQVVIAEREQLIFETLCPEAMSPELIETLQRALEARGFYRGPITGKMDIPTQRAVRRYQRGRGLPSGLLSMQSARALGLIATPRSEL